jgi:hypothetical protein
VRPFVSDTDRQTIERNTNRAFELIAILEAKDPTKQYARPVPAEYTNSVFSTEEHIKMLEAILATYN